MCYSTAESSVYSNRDILPCNVKPTHYNLSIKPDMEKFTFDGLVKIKVEVKEATKTICLNAHELSGFKANLELDDNKKLVATSSMNEKSNVLSLEFEEELAAGVTGLLVIEYVGCVNDKMAGFYRSSYSDKATGDKKHMLATQFEATDARKAFPCWDEPNVKAVFEISLTFPSSLVGLSNMDEAERTEHDGLTTIRFNPSPIMSTYLVAWVIGELEAVEATNSEGVLVRVWAPKGNAEQGRFGLDVACRTLAFFNGYFDIPYPLPKMDMVAVPDFSAGAMENWGLVTYRTACLLFDEAHSSLKSKQRIAYVVCHELAHQWFGNLVTMDWWSDLWLNEGFATWVGWLASDFLFPEWDIWTEFVVDDCQAGLALDGLRSSHPIEVPVKNPDEIGQIFDSISYSKGASLIRQLVAFLTEDTFRTGLRAYLKRHKHGNARTQDLWASLAEASGQPVDRIMHAWTRVMGYPVLNVKCEESGDKLKLHLSQSRFLKSGDLKPEEDETLWAIPLRLGTSKALQPAAKPSDDLMTEREQTVEIDSDVSFFKFNVQQAGFYRVNYPVEWLEKLGKAVSAGQIPAADRIGIVSDAFALSVAGVLPITCVLDLLKNFGEESDFLVWSEISSRLSEVLSVWWEQPSEVTDSLKAFIVELYRAQADKLGFDFAKSDDDKTKLLRPMILGMAAKCGYAPVIEECKRRFKQFIAGDEAAIHPNLRGVVYATVLRNGGRDEFDAILGLYKRMLVPDQKLAALGALGAASNADLINEALGFTMKDEVVRPQDVIYVFSTVGNNPAGRRLCWEFLKANWDFFGKRYSLGGGISLLGRIVSTSTDSLTAAEDSADVQAFFRTRETAAIERSIAQSVEKINSNAQWLSRNRQPVIEWLSHNVVSK